MRAGNLTDMRGYSLQRLKIVSEIPIVNSNDNGNIYLYVGEQNTIDIHIGDIFIVQEGKLVVINRNSLQDISDKGLLSVTTE